MLPLIVSDNPVCSVIQEVTGKRSSPWPFPHDRSVNGRESVNILGDAMSETLLPLAAVRAKDTGRFQVTSSYVDADFECTKHDRRALQFFFRKT